MSRERLAECGYPDIRHAQRPYMGNNIALNSRPCAHAPKDKSMPGTSSRTLQKDQREMDLQKAKTNGQLNQIAHTSSLLDRGDPFQEMEYLRADLGRNPAAQQLLHRAIPNAGGTGKATTAANDRGDLENSRRRFQA